jgi:hypothetical protein
MGDFRNYVKSLNHHELQNLRDDFLFKVGDKEVKDLTKKELKQYNDLKPIRHDIYGFNLPLYYEMSKNGQVKYQASSKKNEGKRIKQFTKLFTGVLFAGMTVNVAFSVDNIGNAFVSLLIISVGLILTYLLTFFPQVFKYKNDLPKKVILKKTLYDSYTNFKNGTHTLKELKDEKPIIELAKEPIEEELKIDYQEQEEKPIINIALKNLEI